MTTGTNRTGKYIWQIWPCGKLYWEAFYEAAGGYRKTLPDKTNLLEKKKDSWKTKGYTRKWNHSKLSQQWQIFGHNDENSSYELS